MPIQRCFTQVHHFKWDSTCIDRIKRVADIKKEYSYSDEYLTMYNSIKDSGFKININNPDFLVEELKDNSYIDYMDYSNWNNLRNKIVLI